MISRHSPHKVFLLFKSTPRWTTEQYTAHAKAVVEKLITPGDLIAYTLESSSFAIIGSNPLLYDVMCLLHSDWWILVYYNTDSAHWGFWAFISAQKI